MKKHSFLPPLLFFILLIALWQLISSRSVVAFWIVPSPGAVFQVFRVSFPLIWHHLQPTLLEAVTGLLLSVLLGSVTSIAMHSSSLVKQILYPYLIISQTIPIIAIAPLLIIWFGYGISSKIFAVVLMCFFPIALGLFDGFRSVPIDQVRLLTSMGASKYKTFTLLYLPSAMPNFFTGLKLSATYSVMGAVIGEWLGGSAGLGIYMTRATKSYQTAHVFAAIIVIVLLSMALFGVVALIDRLLMKWKYMPEDEYNEVKGLPLG